MRRIAFNTATVYLADRVVFSLFDDGAAASLELDKADNAYYRGIAAWAGFPDDHEAYAVTHDLTHHWLADQNGRPSPALWEAAHRLGPSADSACEEAAINALQRAVRGCALQEDERLILAAIPGRADLDELVAVWRRALPFAACTSRVASCAHGTPTETFRRP